MLLATLRRWVISVQKSDWVSEQGLTSPRHITGHFEDESFQAIDYTSTENWKQENKTLHTPETQKTNRKKLALADETNQAHVWYAFDELQAGKAVDPILTTPDPIRAVHKGS